MSSPSLPLIDVDRLQPGVYVVLDLGWRSHPFLRSSFTLRSDEQIAQIRELGLRQVRYSPERSSVQPLAETAPPASPAATAASVTAVADTAPIAASEVEPPPLLDAAAASAVMHRSSVEAALRAGASAVTAEQWQQLSEARSEREYAEAARQHQWLVKHLAEQPLRARQVAIQLGESLCQSVVECDQPAVRLLSDQAAQVSSGHEVGVAALAVLLGHDHGMPEPALRELAVAALLHDVGKQRIPTFLHEDNGRLTDFERRSYQQHVRFGIDLLQPLSLSQPVLQAIEQHHEHFDGSGFPARLKGERIGLTGRVLAIANRYLNLVCPKRIETGLSPHQALKQMYGAERDHFDPGLLNRFVRLLGVYPPGTLVELNDQRMAVVVGSRPGAGLTPRVQIMQTPDQDPDSNIIDLFANNELGIRRTLPPDQLNPKWAQRSRQFARRPVFIESQSAPEWAAWEAEEVREAALL